jgi:protein-S-isoprenylcysteine O-methyltransferase Ste14
MSTTPPLYDQLTHGTVRNRALVWFADHSYRRAATQGAACAVTISVVVYLVQRLDELMPGTASEPPLTMRWFLMDSVVMVLLAALVMCLATAGARGLMRLYVRTRTGRGLT